MLVRYLPRESATVREVGGPETEWGVTEHMLATVIDALNGANWQRAANKNSPRPRPVPRPGVVDKDRQMFGNGPVTIGELHARFGLPDGDE